MPKIMIDCTAEQLTVFKEIGERMRATPAEVILSAACGYVGPNCDDEAEEYSAMLYLHVVLRQAPEMPQIFQYIEEESHANR